MTLDEHDALALRARQRPALEASAAEIRRAIAAKQQELRAILGRLDLAVEADNALGRALPADLHAAVARAQSAHQAADRALQAARLAVACAAGADPERSKRLDLALEQAAATELAAGDAVRAARSVLAVAHEKARMGPQPIT